MRGRCASAICYLSDEVGHDGEAGLDVDVECFQALLAKDPHRGVHEASHDGDQGENLPNATRRQGHVTTHVHTRFTRTHVTQQFNKFLLTRSPITPADRHHAAPNTFSELAAESATYQEPERGGGVSLLGGSVHHPKLDRQHDEHNHAESPPAHHPRPRPRHQARADDRAGRTRDAADREGQPGNQARGI